MSSRALTLGSAARQALDVLHAVQANDAGNGITDPDVAEAVSVLEAAIARSSRNRNTAPRRKGNRWGFGMLQPMRVVGGAWAGSSGRFMGAANQRQVYIEIDGVQRSVAAINVERVS